MFDHKGGWEIFKAKRTAVRKTRAPVTIRAFIKIESDKEPIGYLMFKLSKKFLESINFNHDRINFLTNDDNKDVIFLRGDTTSKYKLNGKDFSSYLFFGCMITKDISLFENMFIVNKLIFPKIVPAEDKNVIAIDVTDIWKK